MLRLEDHRAEGAPQLMHVPIGLMSPLWLPFAAAAGAGVAYWWMTRWTRAANLEALAGAFAPPVTLPVAAEPAFAAPEPSLEVVAEPAEAAAEGVETAADETVEAAADPTPAPKKKPKPAPEAPLH